MKNQTTFNGIYTTMHSIWMWLEYKLITPKQAIEMQCCVAKSSNLDGEFFLYEDEDTQYYFIAKQNNQYIKTLCCNRAASQN